MPWPRISTQLHLPSAGERRAERPVAHEQVVLLAHFADVEHRRARPEERAHVIDRPQLACCVTPKGITEGEWLCTTAITSGRAR